MSPPSARPASAAGATWNRRRRDPVRSGDRWRRCFACRRREAPPTPVTVLDTGNGETAHVSPLFLPDGRHFVFAIIGGDAAGHYVASLDSPERKRLSTVTLGRVDARLQLTRFPVFHARPHPDGPAVRPEPSRADRGADSRGGGVDSLGMSAALCRLRERYARLLGR